MQATLFLVLTSQWFMLFACIYAYKTIAEIKFNYHLNKASGNKLKMFAYVVKLCPTSDTVLLMVRILVRFIYKHCKKDAIS